MSESLISDRDEKVRVRCAECLGRLKIKAAIPLLSAIVDRDPSELVKKAILEALEKIQQ